MWNDMYNYMERDSTETLPQLEDQLIWNNIISFSQFRMKGNNSINYMEQDVIDILPQLEDQLIWNNTISITWKKMQLMDYISIGGAIDLE